MRESSPAHDSFVPGRKADPAGARVERSRGSVLGELLCARVGRHAARARSRFGSVTGQEALWIEADSADTTARAAHPDLLPMGIDSTTCLRSVLYLAYPFS